MVAGAVRAWRSWCVCAKENLKHSERNSIRDVYYGYYMTWLVRVRGRLGRRREQKTRSSGSCVSMYVATSWVLHTYWRHHQTYERVPAAEMSKARRSRSRPRPTRQLTRQTRRYLYYRASIRKALHGRLSHRTTRHTAPNKR